MLICYNVGRLGRKRSLITTVIDLCYEAGILVYRTSSPPASLEFTRKGYSDLLIEAVESATFQNEVDQLREHHRTGMIRRTKRGFLPGNVPFGYVKVFDDKGKVKSYKVDEAKAETIRRIFDLYAAGGQYEAILSKLEGSLSPSGKRFTIGGVKRILERVWQYCGYIEYNRRGEREFIRVKSAILPPIIDETLLQRVVSEQGRRAIGEIVQGELLYSGVVFCTRCNRRMACITNAGRHRRDDGTLYTQPIVRCDHCKRSVTWRRLDRELLTWFESLPQEMPPAEESEDCGLQAEHDRVQSAIAGIERAQARAFDAYIRELTDELTYLDAKKRLEGELGALEDRLHLVRLQIAQEAHRKPTVARYNHVREVGSAMLALGKGKPATVNAWMREYIRIELGEDRKLAVSMY